MPNALTARRTASNSELSSPSESGTAAAPAQRICSGCYLTEAEWNQCGIFGCSRCYETFAETIVSAVLFLHGVKVPEEWARPKPRRTITMPWGTRRGVRL